MLNSHLEFRSVFEVYRIFIRIIVISLIISTNIFAQKIGPWRIHNPAPDSRIIDGELFIALSLGGDRQLSRNRTFILIDGKNVTKMARISHKKLTLLFTSLLGTGKHRIIVLARDAQGNKLPPLQWWFEVGQQKARPSEVVQGGPAVAVSGFEFSGNMILNSRSESLTGAGIDLRQEPSRTNTFQLNARAKYKRFTFPVKVFVTSDENNRFQPRNRFRVGIQSSFLEVYYGDNTPMLDRFIWNGARMRGVQGRLHLAGIHLNVLHGEFQRPIEGQLQKFQPGVDIPPPDLRPDSTFVVGGTFRREVTAVRLSFGNKENILLGFTGLKAKDDTASIEKGEQPRENLVVGGDLGFAIYRNGGFFKLQGGAAISLTTNDISTGPVSNEEIDSLFGVSLPFDPQDFENIMTLNTTTFPIRVYKGSSLAWYGKGQLKLASHLFTSEYKSIGASYVSFGNPYLRNDRRGFSIGDRFRLLGRKLVASLRYQKYRDNLSNNQVSSRNTTGFLSNVTIAPSPKSPRFQIGYRLQSRTSDPDLEGRVAVDDRIRSISLGADYNFHARQWRHGLSVFFTHVNRDDDISPERGNSSRSISLGLQEQFPFPLLLGFKYLGLRVETDTQGLLQSQKTIGASLRYRIPGARFNFSIKAQNTTTTRTDFSPESSRFHIDLSALYQIFRDMALEIQIGFSGYREQHESSRDYDETYFIIRHTYGFNFQ